MRSRSLSCIVTTNRQDSVKNLSILWSYSITYFWVHTSWHIIIKAIDLQVFLQHKELAIQYFADVLADHVSTYWDQYTCRTGFNSELYVTFFCCCLFFQNATLDVIGKVVRFRSWSVSKHHLPAPAEAVMWSWLNTVQLQPFWNLCKWRYYYIHSCANLT